MWVLLYNLALVLDIQFPIHMAYTNTDLHPEINEFCSPGLTVPLPAAAQIRFSCKLPTNLLTLAFITSHQLDPAHTATKPRDKHMTQPAAKKSTLSFSSAASFFTPFPSLLTFNRKSLFLNRNKAASQIRLAFQKAVTSPDTESSPDTLCSNAISSLLCYLLDPAMLEQSNLLQSCRMTSTMVLLKKMKI